LNTSNYVGKSSQATFTDSEPLSRMHIHNAHRLEFLYSINWFIS